MERPVTIWGFHPIREFAIHRPEALLEVGVIPTFGRKKRDKSILAILERRGVPVTRLDGLHVMGVPSQAVHQGIAALVKPVWNVEEGEFKEIISKGELASSHIMALDEITDPHNFGAILRAAISFGITHIVVQRRSSAPVTGVVAKSSSGALAVARIIQSKRLRQILLYLKDNGWTIVGLDPNGDALLWDSDLTGQKVFVLGAEEKGLRKTIRGLCHTLCRIPLEGGTIQSLNVSQASAIVAYEATRQVHP